MNMSQKLSAEVGVCSLILKKGLVDSAKRGRLNTFISKFLKENNLKTERYNPRYKGHYDALNVNCRTVQENWDKFHIWVNEKVKEKDTLTVG